MMLVLGVVTVLLLWANLPWIALCLWVIPVVVLLARREL